MNSFNENSLSQLLLEKDAAALSDQEKKEVDELVQSFPSEYDFMSGRSIEAESEKLRAYGTKATQYIIEKVRELKNSSAIFDLLGVLKYMPLDSKEIEIGKLLELEHIVHNSDRSNKHKVLEILNRIAVIGNVPQLKKYGEMSFETNYRGYSNFNRDDVVDVIQTLMYLKSSLDEENEEDKRLVDTTISYLNKMLSKKGLRSMVPSELSNLELISRRSDLLAKDVKFKHPFLTDADNPFDDAEHIDELDDPFDLWDADESLFSDEDELEEQPFQRLIFSVGRKEKNKTVDNEYSFFTRDIERSELFEYCKKVAEYLHNENISNLVIIDRSSRPLYIGVKEYWRFKYPNDKQPNIYFMNPRGFKTPKDLNDRKICESSEVRDKHIVLDDFQTTYKKLMEDKDKPVLIFDSCIHSGNTLLPVKRAMEASGFKDLIIGSINPSDSRSSVKTDFYITKLTPEKGCYPFDRDRIIEKVFYSPYSKKTSDQEQIQRSVKLRREIKKVMEEKIESLKMEI